MMRFWSRFLPVLLLFPAQPLIAQNNDQMVRMVKNMIQQFEEFTPEDFDRDHVINEGAAFNPNVPFQDKAYYSDILKEPAELFTLSDYENGYAIVDEQELPTNSINLTLTYLTLPGFTNLNAWYDISSIEDSKGNNLLLSNTEIESYREYGIIDDEFNYPVPGEFSLRQWLNRELVNSEQLTIKGTVNLEYPSDYQLVAFSKEDTGKTKSIGNTTIRLVEIDRNMVTLIMKGNRRETEGLSMIVLNADGKMFNSTSSIAIDAGMYDEDQKTVRDLSEDEITASVENFHMSDSAIEQVKKIRVPGNVHQIAFVKIDAYDYLDTTFSISKPFEY